MVGSGDENAHVDWSDIDNIRDEWVTQLEGVDEGMLGWQNGMRMFDAGQFPKGLVLAEYMTRGLAYDIVDQPILSDEQAVETVRRILTMIESIPSDSPHIEFAPRIARLALAVARKHGWQPTALGGDGQVTEQILSADRQGIIWSCVSFPGAAGEEALTNFFSA